MAKEKHSLPAASLSELEKIIKGYYHAPQDANLGDIAKLVGKNRTSVSSNNPFLAELGIVTEGKKKSITDIGAKLGRAIEHDQSSDFKKYLGELVSGSEFFSQIITTVRIKSGMTVDDLEKHILYVSDQSATKENKTGSKTIVDLYVKGGLLTEEDGKLVVTSSTVGKKKEVPEEVDFEKAVSERQPAESIIPLPSGPAVPPNITPTTININIQLEIPESDNPEVYELFFKALKKYVLTKDE